MHLKLLASAKSIGIVPAYAEEVPAIEVNTYWNLPQNGGQTAAKSLKSAWNQLECHENVSKCGEKAG